MIFRFQNRHRAFEWRHWHSGLRTKLLFLFNNKSQEILYQQIILALIHFPSHINRNIGYFRTHQCSNCQTPILMRPHAADTVTLSNMHIGIHTFMCMGALSQAIKPKIRTLWPWQQQDEIMLDHTRNHILLLTALQAMLGLLPWRQWVKNLICGVKDQSLC